MLMEYFFEAVARAFIKEDGRVLAAHGLELKIPPGLPLSALEGTPSAPSSGRRRQRNRRQRDRRAVQKFDSGGS
jgi:hypothetical protein